MKIVGLVLAAGLVFGVGAGEVRRFERALAADISSKLDGANRKVTLTTRFNGPLGALSGDFERVTLRAEKFTCDRLPLFVEPERTKRGKMRRLDLELSDFTLGSLDVQRMEASIPNCRYDLGLATGKKQARLSESGTGTGKVWITESALEKFILAKFREIQRVKVTCDRGFVWIEGYGEFLIVATEFRILTKLAIVDGTKLTFLKPRVAFDGLPADEFASKAMLDAMDPVVDLNKDLSLDGAIMLKGVDVSDGTLTAWGATRIPERPR